MINLTQAQRQEIATHKKDIERLAIKIAKIASCQGTPSITIDLNKWSLMPSESKDYMAEVQVHISSKETI